MRVIAGSLGGRQFEAPSGHKTHPMSEKARGGLFNALGDIEGLTVLDAYAGSGALSFEAISRGAASATAVESDKTAHGAISRNIIALGARDKVKAIQANVSSWSDNNSGSLYDIVLADPPYDGVKEFQLNKLSLHAKPTGLVVVSFPSKSLAPKLKNMEIIKLADYGDAQLAFYRRIS